MVYSRNGPHDEAERNVLQPIFFRPWEAIGCRAPGAVAVAEDVDVTSCDVTSFRFSATVMKIEATLFPGIHRHFKFQCFTFFCEKLSRKSFFWHNFDTRKWFFQSINPLSWERIAFLLKMHSGKRNDVLAPTRVSLEIFCVSFNFLVFFYSMQTNKTKQNKTRIVSEANKRTNERIWISLRAKSERVPRTSLHGLTAEAFRCTCPQLTFTLIQPFDSMERHHWLAKVFRRDRCF